MNAEAIKRIATNHPDLTIQLGGGIRSPEVIEAYLEAGVDYLIIGTKAVQEPCLGTSKATAFGSSLFGTRESLATLNSPGSGCLLVWNEFEEACLITLRTTELTPSHPTSKSYSNVDIV